MKYKLTWKRKMNRQHLRSIAIGLLAIMGHQQFMMAQSDSLQPVQLKPVELRWVNPGNELPFSGTNVNREEIKEKLGNGSINNLMEAIPSMLTSSDAGTGIGNTSMSIRGIDHTRINVTINGIELNDAESQGTWFVNLPNFAAYTQSLSLQRGVGTSTNGAAAFGASMNFNTLNSDESKPFAEVSSAAGSFATFRNSIAVGTGLIKDRFSVTASYSNLQSKGYIDRATANLNSIYLSADYRLFDFKKNKDYGKLTFNMLYGKEKTGLSWDGTPSDSLKTNRTYNPTGIYYDDEGNMHYYDNETDNYQQSHYQLFYNKIAKAEGEKQTHLFDINVGLHLTRGIGYYEQYKDDTRFSKYGLPDFITTSDTISKTDLVRRKFLDNYFYGFSFNVSDDILFLNNQQKLKWSLGGALNRYDGKHYGTLPWMQYAGDIPANYQWYYNEANKTQGNIFAKVEYMPIERLLIYGDVQYRHIQYSMYGIDDNMIDITQNYQWDFFNPKIGIHVYVDRKRRNAIYFSSAISHREPTRSNIVDAPVNNKPTRERLYDIEAGYYLQMRKFSLNANLYYMYYQDQLVLTGEVNDVGDAIMTNVDKSYRAGIELVASYRPVKFFLWKINGTFSLNKIKDYTHYIDNWDTWGQEAQHLGTTDISFSPNIIAGNEFIFTPLKNFDISLFTKFVSKQYMDNTSDDNHVLKAYSTTNLHLSYTIHTRPISAITLFFQANNIFNAKYETGGWLYKYLEGSSMGYMDGYYPQAGINFMGGVTLRF